MEEDWDKHLPQMMDAYTSTEHSNTGVSPHTMLTGHEKALLLLFFYTEYEGSKPQTHVIDVTRAESLVSTKHTAGTDSGAEVR